MSYYNNSKIHDYLEIPLPKMTVYKEMYNFAVKSDLHLDNINFEMVPTCRVCCYNLWVIILYLYNSVGWKRTFKFNHCDLEQARLK